MGFEEKGGMKDMMDMMSKKMEGMEGCGPDKMKEMMGQCKDMMSKKMEECGPDKMTEMMNQCVGAMVQHLPQEKRSDFVLKMVATLIEQGAAGMSEPEKKDFMGKVAEKMKV